MTNKPKSRWLAYVVSVIILGIVAFALVSNYSDPAPSSVPSSMAENQNDATVPITHPAAETLGLSASLPPTEPVIENVRYRKTSPYDPGTLRVYLRNGGSKALVIKQILLDSLPITTWGVELSSENVLIDGRMASTATEKSPKIPESAALRIAGERVHWAKLSPNPVPPSGIAEFSAKLANSVDRPIKVELVADDGKTYTTIVHLTPSVLTISGITFSEDLNTTYVYAENKSDQPLQLASIEIDGLPVVRDIWVASKTLPPASKELIIIKGSREAGTYITLRLLSAEGPSAEERVRVFAGFPLGCENGVGSKELELDETPYFLKPAYLTAEAPLSEEPGSPLPPSLQANYIFNCPVHIYGRDYARVGREIFRRHDLCRHFDPYHPTSVYLCRSLPETGYALFAETSDILSVNPNIPDIHLLPETKELPARSVEKFAHLAYLAAQPRPFVSLADVFSIDDKTPATASDFRARTYSILAAGAKGILYRNRDTQTESGELLPVDMEALRLNKMLRSIRPLLSIADPVDWVSMSQDRDALQARALLAGDKALFVFLIDQNAALENLAVSEGEEEALAADGEERVGIKITVPSWVKLTRAECLDDDEQSNPELEATDSGLYELRTSLPVNGASLFMLPITKEESR